METVSTSLGRTIARQDAEEQQAEQIDFKMVTFSLGGKDYGIDIMQIKEIAKFAQFTYVPNSPPFVRGVYNLRGDIISIIDLRLLFNLPVAQKAEGSPENGLILRLEDNKLIGVIVDEIDKVVGISSETIQPPHPIFGDINIKFISGVVENEGRLYIILDVERIFRKEEEEEKSLTERAGFTQPASRTEEPKEEKTASYEGPQQQDEESAAYNFVTETLETFLGFHVTPLNDEWVRSRFQEWRAQRGVEGAQLKSKDDAQAFIVPFYSQHTRELWPAQYMDSLARTAVLNPGSLIQVWNPGCGEGAESYSLAVMLREHYPEKQVKVWASDNDLLGISNAPNVIYDRDRVPERYEPYIVDGKNGPTFSTDIKNLILFEYSDLIHAAGLPAMDLIVARDVLSFFPQRDQERVLETMFETLKPNGYLILGTNEEPLDSGRWEVVGNDQLHAYRKRS